MSASQEQFVDRYIDVDGASLRVRSAGAGPAIVLVHGWALDLDMWQPQIDALANWYRVIAFDRRGFGHSSGLPGIEHDVADIDRLLDVFGIAQAAIIGMSQGARVALRWAMKHPQRALCLVLDGPPREGLPQVGAAAQEIPMQLYRDLVRREGSDAFRSLWQQHPFMQLWTSDSSVHQRLRQIAARYPARDLEADEVPQRSPVGVHDLQELTVPTLLINGARDSDQRLLIAAQMAHVLPNAQSRIIADAGHLAALDNPDAYVQALIEFFQSQPALAAGARH